MVSTKADVSSSVSSVTAMQKRSDSIYTYEPPVSASQSEKSTGRGGVQDPKVILIFGWTAATNSQLGQYVEKYQVMFPSSSIILVKSSAMAMTYLSLAHQNAKLVATALRDLFDYPASPQTTENTPKTCI
jgi:hypothetical protein